MRLTPRVSSPFLIILAFLSAHGALAQAPEPADVWVPLGPFGAVVSTVTASPGDPGIVFAGTNGGLFRSDDGLATWRPISISGYREPGVRALWIDSTYPSLMVAATDQLLFRSTDGGATWVHSVVEPPLPGFEQPVCLAGDPSSPGTVYACSGSTYFVNNFGFGVLKSSDDGATFHPASPQLARANVTALLVIPGSPAVLVAAVPQTWGQGAQASPTGVLASLDSGATWTQRNAGLVLPAGQPGPWQLACDEQSGTLFTLVAATGAVFASHDEAMTWTPLATPASAGALAFSEGALYLSATPSAGGRTFRSTDGGASWSATAAPSPASVLSAQPGLPGVYAAARQGLIISADSGDSWRLSRRGLGDRQGIPLAVDRPGDSLYALWGEDLYRRTSNGLWHPLGGFFNQLVVDPVDSRRQLAVSLARLLRSRDGGVTWQPVQLPNACVEIGTVAVAPSDPRVIYAGGSAPEGSGPGHHPPPDPSCLHKCQSWRSDNRGASWSCLPLDGVSSFTVDPRQPRTVYALGAYSEAFPSLRYIAKSVDGGRTWTDASHGLNQLGGFVDPSLLTIDRTAPSRLFTFVDRTPGYYLFASEDGGASWSPHGQPLPTSFPVTLLLAHSRPDVFYVGTFSGGVLRSANAGATWTQLAPGVPPAQLEGSLIADPNRPLVFYAGTAQRGVVALRRSRP